MITILEVLAEFRSGEASLVTVVVGGVVGASTSAEMATKNKNVKKIVSLIEVFIRKIYYWIKIKILYRQNIPDDQLKVIYIFIIYCHFSLSSRNLDRILPII